MDRQVQLNHRELLEYLGFRIRIAVGGLICLIALFLPTLGTWFSDNPSAGGGPGDGVIDHWNLWLMVSGGQGGGDAQLPEGLGPAGFEIGDVEKFWAWLVLLALAFTVVMLVRTAMDGRWPFALTASIGAAVTLVAEFVLRFAGGSDDGSEQGGQHIYDAGVGLTLGQVAAAAVAIWAVSVMITVLNREA